MTSWGARPGLSTTAKRLLTAAIISPLLCQPAAAQVAGLAQDASLAVPRTRTVPLQEEVDQALKAYPLHLGPFRLQPILGLFELGYVSNVYNGSGEQTGDFRVSPGGGMGVALRGGNLLYLRGSAVAKYHWFSKNDYLRNWGGDYSASFVTYVGRLSLTGHGSLSDTVAAVTTESQQLAEQRYATVGGGLEYQFLRRLSLFADGSASRREYGSSTLPEGGAVNLAGVGERRTSFRGGIRYAWREDVKLAFLAEQGKWILPYGEVRRDYDYTSYIGALSVDRSRLFVNLAAGYREYVDVSPTSSAAPENGPVLALFTTYRLTPWMSLELYGDRMVAVSVYAGNSNYANLEAGAGLVFTRGRGKLGLYWQGDRNDYQSRFALEDGQLADRRDTLRQVYTRISLPLIWRVNLGINASYYWNSSSIPGFDRTGYQISTTVDFGSLQVF